MLVITGTAVLKEKGEVFVWKFDKLELIKSPVKPDSFIFLPLCKSTKSDSFISKPVNFTIRSPKPTTKSLSVRVYEKYKDLLLNLSVSVAEFIAIFLSVV